MSVSSVRTVATVVSSSSLCAAVSSRQYTRSRTPARSTVSTVPGSTSRIPFHSAHFGVIVNATPTPYDAEVTATLAADVDAVMVDLAEALSERQAA